MKSNKEIVVEFINATNQKDWERVLTLVHNDFIRHSSSEPKEIKTPDVIKQKKTEKPQSRIFLLLNLIQENNKR